MRAWLLVVWKRFRERERGARQRGCTLAVIQVSGRRTDKGWAWRSARAFCGGIDYSLLSRCTGRVKSTPLPASLSHLLFQRSPLYLISTLLFFFTLPSLLSPPCSLPAATYFFGRKLAHLWAKLNNWGTIALTYRDSSRWIRTRNVVSGVGRSWKLVRIIWRVFFFFFFWFFFFFSPATTGLIRRLCLHIYTRDNRTNRWRINRGLWSRVCISWCFYPDKFLRGDDTNEDACGSGASVDSFSKPLVRRTDKVESIDSSSFHLRIHSNPRGIDQRLRLDTSAHLVQLKREKPLTNRVPSLWWINTMEKWNIELV